MYVIFNRQLPLNIKEGTMGVFEALAKGFTAVNKNLMLWLLLVGVGIIMIIIAIPMLLAIFGPAVFQMAAQQPGAEQTLPPSVNWPLFIVFIIISFFFQVFVNAGTVGCVNDIVKTNTLKIGQFLKLASKYFLRYIIFSLVMLILAIVIMIGFVFSLGGAAVMGRGGSVAPAILVGVISGLISLAFFAVIGLLGSIIPVSIVSDEAGVIAAFGNAFSLLKKKFFKTFGLGLCLWLIFLILTAINYMMSLAGPAAGLVSQLIVSVISSYLSLVYIASFMNYYLGNK